MRMDDIERKVRRYTLKPLSPRSRRAIGQTQYEEALRRLDDRALGESDLQQLRDDFVVQRESGPDWKDPARARASIALVKALYASRRISRQEYVFYALVPAEGVHDGRWLDGNYDRELKPIQQSLRRIEKEHGLGPDEDWPRGQGPKEHTKLNRQYENILESKYRDTLLEFGLDDLVAILDRSRKEFDELRERGRRSVHHHGEYVLALKDVILEYETQAKKAAAVGAYSAAVTSLGAGVEGLLLLRCLRASHKAAPIAKQLPKRLRPRFPTDASTWTFETLIEVCLVAKWLRPVETSVAIYNTAGIAHILRHMRNRVHPGRHARERPWSATDEQEYRDAEAFYLVMMSKLGGVRQKRS